MVAACSGASDDDETAPPTPDTPTSSAPSAVPSSPPATSAADYQAALSALDEQLAKPVRKLRRQRKPGKLAETVMNLRGRVDDARTALAAVPPPTEVADAHSELDTALSNLSSDLTGLEAAASSGGVCAGDAAIRRLSNSDAADAVRQAAAGLADSGSEEFTVGAFLPEKRKERNRRGRNGDVRPGVHGGLGQLQITGAPNSDALIKLRVKDRPIRDVYVRKGSTVTVEGLPDGNYRTFLAQGRDWDDEARRFTRDCAFSRFDDRMKFTTTATQYTFYQLQLFETIGGNATSTELSPDEFPD